MGKILRYTINYGSFLIKGGDRRWIILKETLPQDIKTAIGDQLTKLRKAAGYKNQQALSEKTGIEKSTIGNWESGRNIPHPVYWDHLVKALNCTLDELFKPLLKESDLDLEYLEMCREAKKIRNNPKHWETLKIFINGIKHQKTESQREEGRDTPGGHVRSE